MATNVLNWSGTKMNFQESIDSLKEHIEKSKEYTNS